MQVKYEEKSKFYKALSDPIRLKILSYLLKKETCTCTCHLSKEIKRDQSVIFRHLLILKEAGIISTKKESKFLNCCIKDKEKIRKLLE